MLAEICGDIPEYAALDDSIKLELVRTNASNARLYLEVVVREKMPSPAELLVLATAARKRVHQGISLEALLRAYRVGARALWNQASQHRPDLDQHLLTDLTLRYVDCTSSAAEHAYAAERASMLNSRSEAIRLLLSRVVEDDFTTATDRQDAVRALGLDLAQLHVAVVIGASGPTADPAAVDDAAASVLEEVRRAVPTSVCALLRRGVVVVIPAGYTEGVGSLIELALRRGPATAQLLTAGIGRPSHGEGGLSTTVLEAERARTLGGILFPDRLIHRYESIDFFDLFRQGDAVEGFVHSVLGDFARHDRDGRTDLVRTLCVYFALGMNRKAAATRLGIHPNSLDYRLRQAVRVGGIDVTSAENSFRFQLAIRLLPICRKYPDWALDIL
jgi:hypothetical protein